jgi:adenine phosphoribosyltransferase
MRVSIFKFDPRKRAPVSIEQIKARIRDVPDFPKPGILFRDITPLLGDAHAFAATVELMASAISKFDADGLIAIESRGFLLGAAVAPQLQLPLQLVRKPGKLPWKTAEIAYALEYGTDRLQIHADAITPGARYAIVDDVLATGGTAAATAELVRRLGGIVAGCAFLIELEFLNGRARLDGAAITSLLRY